MTDEHLQAIHKRAAAASVGPWEADKAVVWGRRPDYPTWRPQIATTDVYPVKGDGSAQGGIDAAFIAHAREDIPLLLAEIDRLRAKVGETQTEPTLDQLIRDGWVGEM